MRLHRRDIMDWRVLVRNLLTWEDSWVDLISGTPCKALCLVWDIPTKYGWDHIVLKYNLCRSLLNQTKCEVGSRGDVVVLCLIGREEHPFPNDLVVQQKNKGIGTNKYCQTYFLVITQDI